MSEKKDGFEGLAFICSPAGIITQVLSALTIGCTPVVGGNFLSLVHESSRQKALLFMESIKASRIVADWELNVNVSDFPQRLHFVGAAVPSGLLVVGSSSDTEADRFVNEFMRMNNELTNTLRAALKKTKNTVQAYEELTSMNNEMATLQRQLLKANHELNESNTLKNLIIGMAAHDLRGPLGSFAQLSDLLLEMIPDLDDDATTVIREMKRSSQNMFTMVNDLLYVSRIEAGKLELHRDQTDLTGLVDRCIMIHRRSAAVKSIRIDHVPGPPVPPITADEGKLEQVINNLLSNAIKYSPHESAITVHVDFGGAVATISVGDLGKGIPLDRQTELFKPFSKVGSNPTGGEKSIGLGLAICRRIVEGHGGRIWVDSVPGAGSTFRFTVPLEASPMKPTEK